MAACLSAALHPRCAAIHKHNRGTHVARAAQREGEALAPPLPPPPPQVGWLWDKKAADTHKRLQEQKLRPKKSLGQNFMLDDNVLASVVDAAALQPGDLVLEIGPGTGNLTRHLLAAGALVTAVEKDYALSEQLEVEFAGVAEMRLVCGDVLRQDVHALLDGMQRHRLDWLASPAGQAAGALSGTQAAAAAEGSSAAALDQDVQQPAAAAQQQGQDGDSLPQQQQQQQQEQEGAGRRGVAGGEHPARVTVVANLPYYITKDCLNQMLPLGGRISDIYFMLQDEVGVRLTQADPGAADWRVMNLLTQYHSRAQYLFRIDRRKYLPAPKVDGAVVRFELIPPHQRMPVPSEPDFIKLVKKAFSQRRKVVRNALRPMYEPADVLAALEAVGLNPNARAQDLTLDQFGQLAWKLHEQTGGSGSGSNGEEQQQQQQQQQERLEAQQEDNGGSSA